ncbi:hypothetical protein ACEPPI_40655, partial [Streptomyces sp. AB3(2024)]
VGALVPAGTAPGWAVAVRVAAALALLVAVPRMGGLPEPVRRGLLWAGAAVAALGALTAVPTVAGTLLSGLGVLREVWAATTPRPAGDGHGIPYVVTLLLAAGALARPAGGGGGRGGASYT